MKKKNCDKILRDRKGKKKKIMTMLSSSTYVMPLKCLRVPMRRCPSRSWRFKTRARAKGQDKEDDQRVDKPGGGPKQPRDRTQSRGNEVRETT